MVLMNVSIKKFETTDYSVLLRELEIYGFRGKFFNLIETFLTNRFQYTDSLEKTSKKGKVFGVFHKDQCLALFFFYCTLMT